MDSLHIDASDSAPLINFDPAIPIYQIVGNSFPEDTKAFYEPIVEWLTNHKPKKGEMVLMHINLDYISSNSLIAIHQILKALKDMQEEHGAVVGIKWSYKTGDEETERVGAELSSVSGLNFEMVEE